MNQSATFSSVPGILRQSRLLEDILSASQHALSHGAVKLQGGHPLSLLAVNGRFVSRQHLPCGGLELTVTHPEALCEWLNGIWFPLQQAALENDAEAFYCAEVHLLKTELKKADPMSVSLLGCELWASLTGLDFISSLPDSYQPLPFRMALQVSRHLVQSVRPDSKLRTMQEWREIIFTASTLREEAVFPPGWLEGFLRRAERIFTSAGFQAEFIDSRLPSPPAGAFAAPQHQYASVQVHYRTPGHDLHAPVGEIRHAPETASVPVPPVRLYQSQSTGPAEEE